MTAALSRNSLPLREYQGDANAAVRDEWARGVLRTAVVLPTGTGKTVTFSHLAAELVEEGARRIVILVHRDELAGQTVRKLESVCPDIHAGIIKAERNDTDARIIVASVQTLRRENRLAQVRDVDYVIVDECHHATADSYMSVLEGFGCFRKDGAKAVGYTATLTRADGVPLGKVWESVAFERTISWAVRKGFLVDPRGHGIPVDDLDLSGVRRTAGDYSDGDLGRALTDSSAPATILAAYEKHAKGRPFVLFTPTVDTAHLMADVMSEGGYPTRAVWGVMPLEERRETLLDAERGRITGLSNCAVLTEGFDWPAASCVIIARPTLSAGLFVQMAGRGLRTHPSKRDAIILDISGAAARHSLVGVSTLAGRTVRDGESLTEAEDRELLEEELTEVAPREIEVVHGEKEIDLFAQADSVWQRTDAGWWFVSLGESGWATIIPGPEMGTWDAAICAPQKGGSWIARNLASQEIGMGWIESYVRNSPAAVVAHRDRAWRKKPASDRARAYATRKGVAFPADIRAGELADRISATLASARIDPGAAKALAVQRVTA